MSLISCTKSSSDPAATDSATTQAAVETSSGSPSEEEATTQEPDLAPEDVILTLGGSVMTFDDFPEEMVLPSWFNEEGEFALRRMLDEGSLVVTLGRTLSDKLSDKDTIAAFFGEDNVELKITEDKALSTQLGCTAYTVAWSSGSNEDTRQDFAVVASNVDEWALYAYFSVDEDYAKDYEDRIDDWIDSLEIID